MVISITSVRVHVLLLRTRKAFRPLTCTVNIFMEKIYLYGKGKISKWLLYFLMLFLAFLFLFD